MPYPGDVEYDRSSDAEEDLDAVEERQDDVGEIVNTMEDDAGHDEGPASSDDAGSGPIELLPQHTIFLSHSGKDKAFVHQLCTDLKAENYFPFFDRRRKCLPIAEKFPQLILEAARTCLAAVIVLSEDFLTSKWPMIELMEFANAREQMIDGYKNANYNRSLRLVPVFYKIGPDELKPPHLDVLWDKLVKNHLDRMPSFDKEKYMKVIRKLCGINGLPNVHGTNETKYRREVTTHILKLVPPALPIDTSGIQACERLCVVIFEMFKTKETKYKGKNVKYKCLGLYGKSGVGKTTICCDAMCHFYQVNYRGRFCRVRLDNEGKAAEGKASDGLVARKRRLARLMAVIKQLVGLPKSMSTIMTEKEGQTYLKDRLHHIKQPVFLVVDNVSESSWEEAKWYASAEFPPDSYVLVTSRRFDLLKTVLGEEKYCERFPILDPEEALTLFLSSANLSEKSPATLEAIEQEIVSQFLGRCSIEDEFIPRLLTMVASFLKYKGDISDWKEYIDHAESILGHEYDNLDDISKLILMDLGIFASDMRYTHVDFHAELEWEEHDSFKLAIEFLAMLHGIPFHDAEKKVKNLQGSFLEHSQISICEDYLDLPLKVITRGGEEKKWCMLCLELRDEVVQDETNEEGLEYFYDLPNEDSSGLVRVALRGVSFDRDLHRLPEWRGVKLLQIQAVRNLPILDLQGLRSLRVLIVIDCEEILKIVCTCNSLFSDKQFCYEKRRGCLSDLRVVQLEYLPKLEDASFARHCRRLETLWFYECPHLGSLPDLRFCRKLKRLRLPCGDFTDFQGLRNNQALTELAFHWERDTVSNFTEEMRRDLLHQVTNLTNLKILDIVDEKELYDWIPAGFPLYVGGLRFLTFLDLSCSSTIEEVEGLELLSELAWLGLYGCCELRTLPNLHKLKKLTRLCIAHCHNLEVEDDISGLAHNSGAKDIIDFHGLGETCSFGEHECLDAKRNSELEDYEPEYYLSEEDDEDDEEEERPRGGRISREKGICKKCNPEKWEEYVAKDLAQARGGNCSRGSPGLEEVRGRNFVTDVPLESLDYQGQCEGSEDGKNRKPEDEGSEDGGSPGGYEV